MTSNTVILLNGSVFSMKQWDLFLELFSGNPLLKNYRFLRYDYRGVGSKFVPNHVWGIDELTAELLGVLDAEGLKKAHLFGWSKGTLVGQCFLARHPERVLSLAGYGWLNPAYHGTASFFSRIQERLSGFDSIAELWEQPLTIFRFWKLWQTVYRKAFLNSKVSPLVEAALVFKLYRLAKPTTIGNMVRWFSYLLANQEALGRLVETAFQQPVPILIQHAKRDDTLPIAMARDARDRYKNARLIEYDPPFGHVSVGFRREQATKVVSDYAEFLTNCVTSSEVISSSFSCLRPS